MHALTNKRTSWLRSMYGAGKGGMKEESVQKIIKDI
jgi:hypothetical protein